MKKSGLTGALALLLGAAAVCVLPSGCETLEKMSESSEEASKGPYQPTYILSFHEVVKYPRGLSKLERKAKSFEGREVWYNANQFLSSEHIDEVKLVPVPDKEERVKVLVHLNRRGKLNWQIASNNTNEMIMLLDGQLIGDFHPARPADSDQEWFELDQEFDSVVADGIVKYAQKNYEYYNPSATGWNW